MIEEIGRTPAAGRYYRKARCEHVHAWPARTRESGVSDAAPGGVLPPGQVKGSVVMLPLARATNPRVQSRLGWWRSFRKVKKSKMNHRTFDEIRSDIDGVVTSEIDLIDGKECAFRIRRLNGLQTELHPFRENRAQPLSNPTNQTGQPRTQQDLADAAFARAGRALLRLYPLIDRNDVWAGSSSGR
jgi:hypothetical protein